MIAQHDTVEEAEQLLVGADAMLRLTDGTYLKAEVAQTQGPGFGQPNSVDGGLSFTDITSPSTNMKAQAYRIEAAVNFAELAGRSGEMGRLSAYYEHFDQGFTHAGCRRCPEARMGFAACRLTRQSCSLA